jgi:hypothetical protein
LTIEENRRTLVVTEDEQNSPFFWQWQERINLSFSRNRTSPGNGPNDRGGKQINTFFDLEESLEERLLVLPLERLPCQSSQWTVRH